MEARRLHVSFISFVGSARRAPTAKTAVRRVLTHLNGRRSLKKVPSRERPKNDGICSFWKKGKDCKFKRPKNSAPAEKCSEIESEAGSEKKKKKKKAKAAPVISTGSLWENSESEAEPACSEEDIVDSENAHPQPRKPSCTIPRKGERKQRAWCPGIGLNTPMVM